MEHRRWTAHYPSGVAPEIAAGPDRTLADLLARSCREHAGRPAFSGTERSLSYADIDSLSRHFAAFLQTRLALRKGDRLALMMPNCLQYVVALFAALRSGIVVVNVNPLYTARELEHELTDAGVRALLVMENFAATLEKILDRVALEAIVTTQLGDMCPPARRVLTNFMIKKVHRMVPEWTLPGAIDFRSALAEGARHTFEPEPLAGDDLALLQYTGGTTGPAKGAMLTHANVLANVHQCEAWFAPAMRAEREIVVTALPLYHIFALTVNLLVYFSVGGQNVLIAQPRDLSGFVRTLSRHRFTAITGVNTLYNGLLNTPGFDRLDFSSLRFCMSGGMAAQKAVADRWQALTGRPIIEGYGLTEASPVIACNRLDVTGFNHSVGFPLPSTDIVIRDDEGRHLPPDAVGELCVRGPQVMPGYWEKPRVNAEAFTADGFFKTGDMARMDEIGLLYIVDRKKDLILVSGFNVYPSEIEDVVAAHDDILEAAAVGVPDDRSGEAVKLFVVKRRDTLTLDDVRRYCRDHLTGYKMPKHYAFIDEIPKSNVGKILRKQLR